MSKVPTAAEAQDRATTPFDYIIVGSGAGGGPLACRLARAGKKVLLLEAGQDPAKTKSIDYPDALPGEIHEVPGYHGAATEDQEMSWQFSVRHYADQEKQGKDSKYTVASLHRNPDGTERSIDRNPDGTGGIFYPRSSGIGGCTGHHAMIVIRPNDRDWNYIADLTNDSSWRASSMNPYFARFERCLYVDEYRGFFAKIFGPISQIGQAIAKFVNPESVEHRGGHGGPDGWQPTSFIAPKLIQRIAKTDKPFTKILTAAFVVALKTNRLFALARRLLVQYGVVQPFDPNDTRTRSDNTEGVFLIPTAFETGKAKAVDDLPLNGRRTGLREFIRRTQHEFPENLVVEEDVHVTRVLIEPQKNGPFRAVGVKLARGRHLYGASPLHDPSVLPKAEDLKKLPEYYTRGEVILCGGAFNTPQLLMLSGVGERAQLEAYGIKCRVDLPGVGRNLQDRYEVGVVSEMKEPFSTLESLQLSFNPGDSGDGGRTEWVEQKAGLYAGNGGTVAVVRRSSAADGEEPDLFTFGVPAAFRGYYWRWSKELLRAEMRPHDQLGEDLLKPQRNLWTWVILKAYTRNNGGVVRLRSASPFATPSICFNSFETGKTEGCEGWEKDVQAVMEAVREMRAVNRKASKFDKGLFVKELQPGPKCPDSEDINSPLATWIRNEAWGHHACGTCRIGSDEWRSNVADLLDKEAVLDAKFRVHGVQNLRVVDASVFPRIPGYFILAPIFMVSEKAADTILADAEYQQYPAAFQTAEARAVLARRAKAEPAVAAVVPACSKTPQSLPEDTIGLALSGGGIRSASFALGILQAMARRNRLRKVDFLSTVSGGGFIGSFLGRIFTREAAKKAVDPCGRVQETLADLRSPSLWWLRTHANYLVASGADDTKQHIAVFFRNIATVYLIMGALLLTIFGVLAGTPVAFQKLGKLRSGGGEDASGFANWLADFPGQSAFAATGQWLANPPALLGVPLSSWWWMPVAAFALAVMPVTLGYWLAPKVGAYRVHPFFALVAWVVLLAGAMVSLAVLPTLWRNLGAGLALVLVLAWLWQEAARWGMPKGTRRPQGEGAVVRNRLTRSLGTVQTIFLVLLGWVLLDTAARFLARNHPVVVMGTVAAIMAAVAPFLPWLHRIAAAITKKPEGKVSAFSSAGFAGKAGPILALILLFAIDILAHRLFAPGASLWVAAVVIGVALVFSVAVGRAFDFLNLSTLATSYGARITRTFQGASNEERIHPTAEATKDVQVAHPGDDIPLHRYHPEEQGGPLHLINVCVNETIEAASQRQIRDLKGLSMSVGPAGVVVGKRFFSMWSIIEGLPKWIRRRRHREGLDEGEAQNKRVGLQAISASPDPNAFHPLASTKGKVAAVESLTLGEWITISGAAFTTGLGRGTTVPMALFMGLVNFRLGRWWDSGVLYQERPGRYPLNLWRKIQRVPISFFRMQSLLLSEWGARFPGPNRWHWYLSDGGHFENTAAYELIRRKLRFIVVSDAGSDGDYQFKEFAIFERQVREDFGVELDWLDLDAAPVAASQPQPGADPAAIRAAKFDLLFRRVFQGSVPPAWILDWVNPDALGTFDELKRISDERLEKDRRSKCHATIARVRYADGTSGWLLLIKPSLTGDEPRDVQQYAFEHRDFPQQPSTDQLFDDAQWESYRALGQHIGEKVLH